MIDINLPQPEIKDRYCVYCGKKKNIKGTLIHWPSVDYDKPMVKIPNGLDVEPFSMWLYICSWCKGADTKRKKFEEASHE